MFEKAIPVWIEGQSEERNSQLVLRAGVSDLKGCILRIAASTFYRLSINGDFAAFGPARAAGGYARVDCIDLSEYDSGNGVNEILIEVAGYHCHSLSTVLEKNFVVAEILTEDGVVLATGRDFEGYLSCRRLQKAERYSLQRHYGELWDEREDNPFSEPYKVKLTPVEADIKFLPRSVPKPDYSVSNLQVCSGCGSFEFDEALPYRKTGCGTEDLWDQFAEAEITYFPYRWLQRQRLCRKEGPCRLPVTLQEKEYIIFDFEKVEAGFLQWTVEALAESEIVIGFSEMCFEKDFEFTKLYAQNVIQVMLPADSRKQGYSFEPYAFRFCILMVKKGSVKVEEFGVRRFARDMSEMLPYEIRDPELKKIYEAGVRTFAHNAVDLFSDCPSRERAGWLCDAYFMGRAEHFLFGKTPIEDAFLENYRLYKNRGDFPQGVLPMVYPSDKEEGEHPYIPQWSLWYILEVAEYLTRRNTDMDRELFRESIFGVLGYFARYENEDGLLCRLPGINFIDWSAANQWGWDINYPTNFLYARALQMTGELYSMPELCGKADRIREIVRKRSFDGEYFVDHAMVDEQGHWQNQIDTSEAAQYYAILFGCLDLEAPEYRLFMQNVLDWFTQRKDDGRAIAPVNAFMGFYLRICVLIELGERKILAENLKAFTKEMIASTGTLWESRRREGSYDHGFAAFAALAAVYADGGEIDR